MNKELTYWMALAHIPKILTLKKNEIIVRLHTQNNSIIDFFELTPSDWLNDFNLNSIETELITEAKSQLSAYAFLVEDLLDQGYNILPITSQDYSPILKKNLGKTYSPPVIYTKGNIQIMKEKSIAIVGSRTASNIALEFADNIARNATNDFKVIVSGFAKGVDKQALESAIKYKGKSIIVLPQGISTFQSGFKTYYKQIIDGDVLVLSTFHPKAPWNVQLAMARNPIIYGLASEIFVAESSEKGGTWSGVIDGLRKKRNIYVRKSDFSEDNSNNILISKGGIAVDLKGNIIDFKPEKDTELIIPETETTNIEFKIIEFLHSGVYSAKEIIEKLNLEWSNKKLIEFLKNKPEIIIKENKPYKFTHKDGDFNTQQMLLPLE